MTLDTATPRTRRAIIAGAVGAVLASVAAFGKTPVVQANDGDNVVLGQTNDATTTTDVNATTTNPAVRVLGGGGGLVGWSQGDGEGLIGRSTNGTASDPAPSPKTGVRGIAEQDASSRGVYGQAAAGQGVRGVATTGIGVAGVSIDGIGVQATSDSAAAVFASNNATTVAAIVATGEPGTAIHGHANTGAAPASPALTGVYGSAALAGVAIAADAASGLAVRATSSAGHGVRGRGALDGVIGESTGARSGVVGYSGGGGAAPAGPAKVGVYGEATQDAASRGVSGFTLSGQGVRGEATSGDGVSGQATNGVGVKATAVGGFALDVFGRARFSRSGQVLVPVNRSYVDITVPGGLSGTAIVFALLQYPRSGVWVSAVRRNYPTAGKVRVQLNKVASTTTTTPLGWIALG